MHTVPALTGKAVEGMSRGEMSETASPEPESSNIDVIKTIDRRLMGVIRHYL